MNANFINIGERNFNRTVIQNEVTLKIFSGIYVLEYLTYMDKYWKTVLDSIFIQEK